MLLIYGKKGILNKSERELVAYAAFLILNIETNGGKKFLCRNNANETNENDSIPVYLHSRAKFNGLNFEKSGKLMFSLSY